MAERIELTRGTTPSYVFTFKESIDFSSISFLTVTIEQWNHKVTADYPAPVDQEARIEIDAEAEEILLTLTQEQTLGFSKGPAKIQARGLLADGTAFASYEACIEVFPVLDERVLK